MHPAEDSAQRGVGPFPLRPLALVLTTGGLLVADWGFRRVGNSVFPGGVLDETAHLLTMLIVLWAIGQRADKTLAVPALVASVAIDLDHIPQELGMSWLTTGTPRPHTHSLLTIAVLVLAACLWKRRRKVLLGLVLGVSVHFVRDLAESRTGVSLLWPWSTRAYTVPHSAYLGAVALLVLVSVTRLVSRPSRRESQSRLPAT